MPPRDATAAVQAALEEVARRGGGDLFLPGGFYRIDGNLDVPMGVQLRGELADPSAGGVRGTVLMARAGRGEADGTPFVTMQLTSGLRDLAIWYPEQTLDDPQPYPFAVRQAFGEHMTVVNVCLVNAWQGLEVGTPYNHLHLWRNVTGSPLARGISIDLTSDIGRLEDIHFSPDYWSASGLPGAPGRAELRDYLRANATAVDLQRSDWPFVYGLRVDGYKIGLLIRAGVSSTLPNGQFYRCRITDCVVALRAEQVSDWGQLFTECTFAGEVALEVAETSSGVMQFLACTFDGPVTAEGGGHLSLNQCAVTGDLAVHAGTVAVANSTLKGDALTLGGEVRAAVLAGNEHSASWQIGTRPDLVVQSDDPLDLTAPPAVDEPLMVLASPLREGVFLSAAESDVTGDETTDDGPALQRLLDEAAERGGGTVFLPPGNFLIATPIVVPEGVTLLGVRDMPHHGRIEGSVLMVTHGRGDEAGPAAVTLKDKAGVRGVTFHYPEQDFTQPTPYSPAVRGDGADVTIANLTTTNAWHYVDLMTRRNDRHRVDFVSGGPLRVGVSVGGGSVGGRVQNTQFNSHYHIRTPYPNRPSGEVFGTADGMRLMLYKMGTLRPFILGDVTGELWFNNFAFEGHEGFRLMDEGGRGPNAVVLGQGIDAAQYSLATEAPAGSRVAFVNTELTTFDPTGIHPVEDPDEAAEMAELSFDGTKAYVLAHEGTAGELVLLNSALWGGHDRFGVLGGGTTRVEQWTVRRIFAGSGGGFAVDEAATLAAPLGHASQAQPILLGEGGAAFDGGVLWRGVVDGELRPVENRGRAVAPLGVIPPPDARAIEVEATHPPREVGISMPTRDSETRLEPVDRAGRQGWATAWNRFPDRTMVYFDVDHPAFVDGRQPQARLTFTYFDAGTGTTRLQYDSGDPSVTTVPQHPGAWKELAAIRLTDSGEWKTVTYEVDDAHFANRLNGKDLRWLAEGIEPPPTLTVGRLEIERAE